MSDEKPESHVRKTVSLTHKQIGVTGLVGLAVALAPYLKETFMSRAEGEKVAIEIEYMRRDISALKLSVDDVPNKVGEQIRSMQRQINKDADRHEKRIENLEMYAFKTRKQNNY